MLRLDRYRFLAALAAIGTVLLLIGGDIAQARPSGGGSFGSRGSRTFSAPPVTRTAPNRAAPIERSATQPSRPSTVGSGAATAGSGFFSRGGILGGLAAGFLGAGLIGLLMGHGFLGGLAGFASFLGLIFQIVLAVIVVRLIWGWWQRRNAPATASGPDLRQSYGDTPSYQSGAALGGGTAAAAPGGYVNVEPSDYDNFERLLKDVSVAYGRGDLTALRGMVTPEMLGYLSEELSHNASRGVTNEVSDVKLLQGDLAEAWREGGTDYATVAMRYAITERTVEQATGRVIEDEGPQEITEIWTFLRSSGGRWILSAIQQAN